jgi:hypothetical protein
LYNLIISLHNRYYSTRLPLSRNTYEDTRPDLVPPRLKMPANVYLISEPITPPNDGPPRPKHISVVAVYYICSNTIFMYY